MYLNPAHVAKDQEELLELIKENPLGILTTAIPNTTYSTIQASHVPWVLDIGKVEDDSNGRTITLRGHIARSNPQAKALMLAAQGASGIQTIEQEVLVLFQEAVHAYVTPKFYTTTKPATEKVVPTWNYTAVQAYGRLRTFHNHDTVAKDFLSKQISDLSDQQERAAGHEKPWRVAQAPVRYIDILMKNIIGIEIEVTRLEGKHKMSQEMPLADRYGVAEGFEGLKTDQGDALARMVRRQLPVQT